MEFVDTANKFLRNFIKSLKAGNTTELYKYAFGSTQFPIWFTIQSLYSIYIVHRSYLGKKRTNVMKAVNIFVQFIESAAMTFAPRELLSVILSKQSPIRHNPQSIYIFLIIFILMNLSPYDIVYKIINAFYYFVGFLQGFNQVRLYTLILRTMKYLEPVQLVPIAVAFTVGDIFIECFMRMVFNATLTPMSNGSLMLETSILLVSFWFLTNRNDFTDSIGIYPRIPATLTLGVVLGGLNAFALISAIFDKYQADKKKKARRQRKHRSNKKKAAAKESPVPNKEEEKNEQKEEVPNTEHNGETEVENEEIMPKETEEEDPKEQNENNE